jgi:peptidoglycan/LPS O-acetylase OafA/YrhL
VVLFHFAPGTFPGGFLGVDVFFVLSGFLLTSLVLVEHHNSSALSVRGFWERRIRRLLPAALATIMVSVVLAFLLEPAYTRHALRSEAVGAITYMSNWWSIAKGNSYASSFGPQSPVAHFWSLAVEEQFYLLFPLLIVGVAATLRLVRRRNWPYSQHHRLSVGLLIIAIFGAITSAITMIAIHTPGTDPSREYLGTDTRVQAILVGVGLACLWYLFPPSRSSSPSRPSSAASSVLLGALLIAVLQADFHSEWLYRGGFTVLALGIGSLIWMLTRHREGPGHRALAARPMRVLGEVSYGLYLWHWPVMVFLTPQRIGVDGFALFSLRLVVTAGATTASFFLIERPFRRPRPTVDVNGQSEVPIPPRSTRSLVLAWGAASSVAVLVVVALTIGPTVGGTTSTVLPPSTGITQATLQPGVLPATEPYTTLWIGDSVMWTLGGGGPIVFPQPTSFTSPFDPNRLVVWNRAVYPCEILRYPSKYNGLMRAHNSRCDNNDWADAAAALRPQIIVFSAVVSDTYDRYVNGRLVAFGTPEFDEMYLTALDRTLSPLIAQQPQIVLLDQALPFTVYEPNGRPSENWRVLHMGELYHRYAASHPRTSVVDLKPIVCPSDPCPNQTPSGDTIRNDGLHFTTAGVDLISPPLAEAIITAARSTGVAPVDTLQPPATTNSSTPPDPNSQLGAPLGGSPH